MAIFEINQSAKPEYAGKQIQLLVRVIIESGSTGLRVQRSDHGVS